MRPVSGRWAPAIAASHAVAHRVEVWREGVLLVPDLPVSGGSVIRDIGADITLSASVEVADPAYLPTAVDDPLMPYGSELRVFLGVRYADNTEELVEVFRGPIVSCPTWPTTTYGFTVRADGWLRYVADFDFVSPYAPSPGVSVGVALADVLLQAVPDAKWDWAPGLADRAVPEGLVFDQSRMDAVKALAGAIGAVVREAPGGGFTVAPDLVPDADAVPVRAYIYGDTNTLLDRSEPELTRDDRYNGVLAINPNDDTVRYLATVDDPGSPVRWDGPFGRRLQRLSNTAFDAGTVEKAARDELARLQGRVRRITAEVAPDPSLEPGDHVLIRWPRNYRARAQVEEVAMVRRVEHPIGPGVSKLELQGV